MMEEQLKTSALEDKYIFLYYMIGHFLEGNKV